MSNEKGYTEERGIKMLKEIDVGVSIASSARTHSLTDQTTYCWRKKYVS